MDDRRFDAAAKALASGLPRRFLLRTALGALLSGAFAASSPRRVGAHATRTGCRPDASVFPGRPALATPFRAVGRDQQVPCGLSVARGVTPHVSGGYADAGGDDTHTDHFFNAFYAVDFSAGPGKSFPVLAAAGGTLVRHDEDGATTLFIKHNDYWQTKYMHLDPCGLIGSIGNGQTLPQQVNQGEQLGWAGKTGNHVTGVHLHFELRGGSTRSFTSFASPRCCGNGNCNWSYPLSELGIPDPPAVAADPCASPAGCATASDSRPLRAIACCEPAPQVVPGGLWISPDNRATVTSSALRFAAHAYPASPSDPAIDSVNFTMWWPGYGPRNGPWLVACTVRQHQGDIYRCDADLARLGVPEGEVTVSFDVYDVAGNHNLAPHGLRTITWRRDTGCTSGMTRCDGRCVDLRTSTEHCGKCDNRCGIFQICCGDQCGCDGSVIVPGWCMDAAVIC